MAPFRAGIEERQESYADAKRTRLRKMLADLQQRTEENQARSRINVALNHIEPYLQQIERDDGEEFEGRRALADEPREGIRRDLARELRRGAMSDDEMREFVEEAIEQDLE